MYSRKNCHIKFYHFLMFIILSCRAKSISESDSVNEYNQQIDSKVSYIFPAAPKPLESPNTIKPYLPWENSYSSASNYDEPSAQGPPGSPNAPDSLESTESSISGRDAGPGTESSDASTTPAPFVGAIDYVLMPLILLGVAAPIFVMMYVVTGIIEFKLPPNVQDRSMESNSNLSSRISSWVPSSLANTLTYFAPALQFAYESARRTSEKDQCIENYSCQIGTFCRRWGLQNYGIFSYENLDEMLLYFFPVDQKRSFRAFLRSIRKNDADCSSLYYC